MFKLDHFSLDHRLTDISLSINAGEKVALLGPSGSGKTTLLKILHQQTSDLTRSDNIAWCPQEHGLVEPLSGYHNIYMGQLQQHNALYNLVNLIKPFAKPKKAICYLASELGLEADLLFKPVSKLSGGQRQRIGIGRALHRQQETFLGDEPVSSLDPVQAQQVLQLIIQRHQTLVLALHNRKQALENFDRIIGLKAGRIVFDSPAKELIKNKYHAGLLDSLYE